MTKILIPEGMLTACQDTWLIVADYPADPSRFRGRIQPVVETALLWLSQNPRPMDISLARELDEKYPPNYNRQVLIAHAAEEWQRRMFLSDEPDEPVVPEEIKDLLLDENPTLFVSTTVPPMQSFTYTIGEFEKKQNAKIIEAYHRGQQSKERS